MAIYVTCEDDADELHRRQANICDMLGVPLAALSGKLHLVSLAGAIGNELATFDPLGRMATSPAWATLRATVLATGASLIASGSPPLRELMSTPSGAPGTMLAQLPRSALLWPGVGKLATLPFASPPMAAAIFRRSVIVRAPRSG